ncbi:sigma-70 family RNA polymerase sigma factor [Candidatus Poribacteria bacterium]|nr:sigma-70 family RNA polymerase sigma factor [Candidatus Poribacteria bacterium]
MKIEDVELIHHILAGDESAFVLLVEKYQKQVHALVWRKIGDFHIAEEITQDTFLKVHQKLSTLKDPRQFSGWLYVIATRECLSWLRKKKIETESLEESENEWIDESVYSQYVVEENAKARVDSQREVVKKLLAKLKDSERTVMTLHYLGEMTVEEISRFLGVSTSVIKIRLHRARQRLQKEETMIREALRNFQLSPNLTENIIQRVENIKPTPTSAKPLIPWMVGASTVLLIVLMLGMGTKYLARFQQPYSLDLQSETTVELVDTPITQNFEVTPDTRNRLGISFDGQSNSNGNGQESNHVLADTGDYIQLKLPVGAKARLSKGRINDISYSPDGTRIAIGCSTGVWFYDANTGAELSLFTEHTVPVDSLGFSSDGKILASGEYDRILLWDNTTGKLLKTLIRGKGKIEKLRFFDNGRDLLCEGRNIDLSVVWNVVTGVKTKDVYDEIPHRGYGLLNKIFGNQPTAWRVYLKNIKDDGILAIGYDNGNIRLKDAATGKTLKFIKGNKGSVTLLMFSPDGRLLVVGDVDGTLSLWDVPTGQLLKTISTYHLHNSKTLTFSNDGKILACQARTGGIELWDVTTRTLRVILEGSIDNKFLVLAFSPDGQRISGGNKKGGIETWDTTTGEKVISFATRHISGNNKLIYSPDSKVIVSNSIETIYFWDVLNYTQLSKRITIDHGNSAIVFSPGGRTLAIAEGFKYNKHTHRTHVKEGLNGKVSLWQTETGIKLYDFRVESYIGEMPKKPTKRYFQGVSQVEFSQNSNLLVVAQNSDRATKQYQFSIFLWKIKENPNNWKIKENPNNLSHITLKASADTILKGHTDKIIKMLFTQNSKILGSMSFDGSIRLWDVDTGDQIDIFQSDGSYALAFSMDSKIFAIGRYDGTISLWDIVNQKQMGLLSADESSWESLAFSTNNKILASGDKNGVIQLWDITTRDKLSDLKGHTQTVNSLTFSPDGTTLTSGSVDGAIFIWDLNSKTGVNTHP